MYLRNIEDSLAAWPLLARRGISRRDFLRFTTIAGSGLTLGLAIPASAAKSSGLTVLGVEGRPEDFTTPFVRIDPDNTVTVICKHVEAGQGVWTGLPAIVAEELDASWDQMRAESSPAKVPTYGNFAFGPQGMVQGTEARLRFPIPGTNFVMQAPMRVRCWCKLPPIGGKCLLRRSPSAKASSPTAQVRRRDSASWHRRPVSFPFRPRSNSRTRANSSSLAARKSCRVWTAVPSLRALNNLRSM